MLMWLLHLLVAGFIAVFGGYFLTASGFVSPHNGAPTFLLFAATLALLRLSERSGRSKPSPAPLEERHDAS